MNPYSIIIDDFLDDFEAFRSHAVTRDYTGMVNPIDGVMYPDISIDIPDDVKTEVWNKAEWAIGRPLLVNKMFMRLSTAGVHVPHQAHTDSVMGDWSLMLYLSYPHIGGTSLLRHTALFMESDPKDLFEERAYKNDMNIPFMWDQVFLCPSRPNRAFIFPANKMHRAEPIGGYGSTPEDGRLVLTAFFD